MKLPQIRFSRFMTLLLFTIVIGLVAGIFFRAKDKTTPPYTRSERCQSRMKNIVLALLFHYEKQGQFPPLTVPGENGNPEHSWRACILPFLEIHDYRMNEPWNSPHNLKVGERATELFACPANRNAVNASDYSLIYYETGEDAGKKQACILIESIHSGLKCLEPGDVSLDELKRGFRSPKDTTPSLRCGGIHRSGKTTPLPDGKGVSFPREELWTDGWFNVVFMTPDHIRWEQFDYKTSPEELLKIAEEVAEPF